MTDDPNSKREIEEEPSDPDLPPAGDRSEHASEGSRNLASADQREHLRRIFESPGMGAFVKQAAEQQERLRKMFESAGMGAFVKQAAEQQERLRKMFESPGMGAFAKQAAEQQERLRKMFESPAWLE